MKQWSLPPWVTIGTLMGMYGRERTDQPILLPHFAEVAYAAEIPIIHDDQS
ncbi:hypothetical protein JXA80_09600 [bacterium]|nr:hypothetical protein [candidate division CSSED10-310 bacterium]